MRRIKHFLGTLLRDFVNTIQLLKYKKKMRSLFGERKTAVSKPAVLIMVYSLYGGGAERVACSLATGLSEQYQIAVIFEEDKGVSYYLDPKVKKIMLPNYKGSSEMRAYFTNKTIGFIKKYLHVKAAISFMYKMNMLNVQNACYGKVICSERNNPARREPEHLPQIEAAYEKADHVVFQTTEVQSLFSGNVRSHSSIIPNPVDMHERWSGENKRIVNLGRLNRQKNQELLIRAFAMFHHTHPEYSLSIYGDGELEEQLRQTAQEEKVEGYVTFHGNVETVHEQIADAEMFVLSSDFEGMSNALMECMAMGMPCISTRCTGSTELIRSGENGILVDIGSVEQLADAMSKLADSPELRKQLGENALLSSQDYLPENVFRRWIDVIEGRKEQIIGG